MCVGEWELWGVVCVQVANMFLTGIECLCSFCVVGVGEGEGGSRRPKPPRPANAQTLSLSLCVVCAAQIHTSRLPAKLHARAHTLTACTLHTTPDEQYREKTYRLYEKK